MKVIKPPPLIPKNILDLRIQGTVPVINLLGLRRFKMSEIYNLNVATEKYTWVIFVPYQVQRAIYLYGLTHTTDKYSDCATST